MAGELPFEYNDRARQVYSMLLSGDSQQVEAALELLEQKDRQLEDFLKKLYGGFSGGSNNFVTSWLTSGTGEIISPLLASSVTPTFSRGGVYFPGTVPSSGFHLECDLLEDGGTEPTALYFVMGDIGPAIFDNTTMGATAQLSVYNARAYEIGFTGDVGILDFDGSVIDGYESVFDFWPPGNGGGSMHFTVDYNGSTLTATVASSISVGGSVTLSGSVSMAPNIYIGFWGFGATEDTPWQISNLSNLSF